MKKIVIGCSVIRKEIEKYYGKSSGFEFDWLEDHLHNIPETLHKKVQSAVDLVLNMLNGITDDRFLKIQPNGFITEEMFRK